MKKRLIFGSLILGFGLFAACAPVTLLNTITPSKNFDLTKDISFDDHPRLSLDIYKSQGQDPKSAIIMFVHGGGWNSGDKHDYKFIGEAFASEGYNVVVPNYRLHPNSIFPDPVVDTAKAVAWTSKKFPDHPLILIGHSAGAYNVLMVGLDETYLSAQGGDLCQSVLGIVSLAGPTGIVPLNEEPYITVFPDRFTKEDAPLNIVKAPAPSLFLVNGGKDKTVYPDNAEALGKKVSVRGGKAKVEIYPDLNHIDVVKVLSRFFDGDSSLKADILSFIEGLPEQNNYCR